MVDSRKICICFSKERLEDFRAEYGEENAETSGFKSNFPEILVALLIVIPDLNLFILKMFTAIPFLSVEFSTIFFFPHF